MLKLFRSYSPYSVIALLLATLILKLFWLIHPQGAIILNHQVVWASLMSGVTFFTGRNTFTLTFLAFVNLVGQAIYFNRIANDAGLFSNRNYLPALCYILFTSLIPEWNYLSAPLIGNWFLLIALNNILNLQSGEAPRKLIFNIGFCIACAGLLSLPYLTILLFLFISLLILRPFRIGEWVISLLGFLTPFYFLIAVLFLTDRLNALENWVPHDLKIVHRFTFTSVKSVVCISFAVLILILGIASLNQLTGRMLMQVKRRWSVLIMGLIISLIALLFEGIGGITVAFPSLIFLSGISANAFVQQKQKWIGRILFYLFLAVLIFAEWIQLPSLTL